MTSPRTIAGLQWQPHGPSFWELVGFPSVEVAYLGAGLPDEGPQWFLFLEDQGNIQIRAFDSRDDACGFVSEALDTPNLVL